jgi:D-tyrosyl-tRNA(Tyr) deacylase
MRAIIQRVLSSHVVVEEKTVGAIDKGLLVLLGVGQGDDQAICSYMADRVAGLRIFSDDDGKMNLSAVQLKLPILVVSQFTLYADVHRGRRPGFTDAAPPDVARSLYESFCHEIRKLGLAVETGVFQADMKVHLVNDGPVTILIDSNDKFGSKKMTMELT